MSKRKRRQRGGDVLVLDRASDMGPAFVRASDGRPMAWGGAASITVEDRPDPDFTERTRLVRGARRRSAINDLQAHGTITKLMHDAVDRFLDDCSLAVGSSGGDLIGMPASCGSRAGLSDMQVAAIVRVRQVWHLLGLNDGTVFWWVVFENGSIRDWEKRHKRRSGEGSEMLRNALSALDEHYNPPGVGKNRA